MSLRVFFRLRGVFSPWRRLEQTQRDRQLLTQLVHVRLCRYATSEPTENEWALDLDSDTEEDDHAPPQSEAHPPHVIHHSSTNSDGRLLFSIGKRLVSAEEMVNKAAVNIRHTTPVSLVYDETVREKEEEEYVVEEEEEEEMKEEEEEGGETVELEEPGRGTGEGGGKKRKKEVKKRVKRKMYQSIRQTKKFLHGRGNTGSRLTTPTSLTIPSLLDTVEECVTLRVGNREMFDTVPSILGSEGREVEERVKLLRGIGFSKREVETVLISYSPILSIDFHHVYEVCRVLKRSIPGGYVLRGLMTRHPFIFLQPVSMIEERVSVLKKLCRSSTALGFLLHHYPILLFTSLTPSTLHTISKFTSSSSSFFTKDVRSEEGEEGGAWQEEEEEEDKEEEGVGGGGGGIELEHNWVANSLYHNLSTRPARMEPGPDTADLVNLLNEFQLEPTTTFIKFPTFFKTSYSQVVSLLNVLSGSPLYLDTAAIRAILVSIPDQLVWNEDPHLLQSHLDLLVALFPSVKDCCEKVVSYPGLVVPQVNLTAWLDSLSSLGFSQHLTNQLLSETPNILLQDREREFLPRLRVLLSLRGATPSSLLATSVSSRIRIFSTTSIVLQERLRYVHKHKPDDTTGDNIEVIFGSKDREFATFCGRTVDQVRTDTGLTGLELRNYRSTRVANSRRTAENNQVCAHHVTILGQPNVKAKTTPRYAGGKTTTINKNSDERTNKRKTQSDTTRRRKKTSDTENVVEDRKPDTSSSVSGNQAAAGVCEGTIPEDDSWDKTVNVSTESPTVPAVGELSDKQGTATHFKTLSVDTKQVKTHHSRKAGKKKKHARTGQTSSVN